MTRAKAGISVIEGTLPACGTVSAELFGEAI
jgi:hypothetical protein